MSNNIISEDRLFVTYITTKGLLRRFSIPLIVCANVDSGVKITDPDVTGQAHSVTRKETRKIEVDVNMPTMRAIRAISIYYMLKFSIEEVDLDLRLEKGALFNVRKSGKNNCSESA